MTMEFNKVTWYSIALAIVLYVGTFFVAFYLGMQFGVALTNYKSQTPITNVQSSNTQTADWKTYTNTKDGFEIKYPSDWAFREYEALGGGTSIGFRPLDKPEGNKYEFIEFDDFERGLVAGQKDCSVPFLEYVKTAYINETGAQDRPLTSIKKVPNVNGVLAYETTWKNNDTPITYFDAKNCKSIQAFMQDTHYAAQYNKMIENFKFTK